MRYQGAMVAFVALFSIMSGLCASEWQVLFNGRDLSGWRANVMPESFTVVNGAIRAHAARESAHLFYVCPFQNLLA